jgi:uncharacterized repeat protein (TIGR04076 family)
MDRLLITVKEIKGNCPVYKVGDRIVLDEGYRLNLKETDNLCMHSLSSIMPYYIALYKGVDSRELGLSKQGIGVRPTQLTNRPLRKNRVTF